MRKSLRTAVLVSAAIGVSGPAAAQSADDGEILVVGETSGVGDVSIGAEALDRRAPTSMGQLFIGETAITSGGATGIAQKTYVHGIEETNINVSIDGATQTNGAFHHTGNVLMDPALLKAVTVKPGVAEADQGPQAVAGSIAYETKDARDLLAPGQTLGGFASVGYQSNGAAFRESASVYGQTGGFEFLVYGSNLQGDDFEDGSGTELVHSAPHVHDVFGKLAYASDDGHRIEFSAEQIEDKNERQARPNFGGVVPAFLERPDSVFDSDRRSATLNYELETRQGQWKPSATLAYTFSRIDVDAPVASGSRTGSYEGVNGKVQNAFDIGIGSLAVGGDFFVREGEGGAATAAALSENTQNVGLFAQARVAPIERVALSIGGRADHQWFEGVDGSDFSNGGLSGNASVELFVTDWLTLEAGYSHVWGGYALGESAIYTTAWNYANFKPSRSDNIRVGAEVSHAGFTAGASLFRTEIDRAHDLQSAARGTSADLKSEGVDASIGYVGERAFARVNYTYAELTENGATPGTTNDYQGLPVGHLFGVETAFRPTEGLQVGASAQIALENDDTLGLAGGAGTQHGVLEAYEVVNFYAEYTPPELSALTIRAELNNAFDETYIARSSNGGAQGALIAPLNEPGRSFGLSAKVTF